MEYKPAEEVYKDDIDKFRAAIPELKPLTDRMIAKLYSCFSEETYCAGWLMLDLHDKIIEQFREWLLVPNIERLSKHESNKR